MDEPPSLVASTVTERAEVTSRDRDKSVHQPPDRGWAWVVLAGVFLDEFIVLGFYGAAAVYVPVWMDVFDSSAAETSLILSLCSFFLGLLSLLAGVLITRFGVRAVWMAGGVMAFLGMLVSVPATGPLYLIFSLGIVTALGFSMCLNSGFVALSQYFNKRRSLAFGIASAGFGVGQLALTPLFDYLVDRYGWRGSLVIVAGITVHLVVAGALVRPLASKGRRRNVKTQRDLKSGLPGADSVKITEHPQDERRQNCTNDIPTVSSLNDKSVLVSCDDKEALWPTNKEDDVEGIHSTVGTFKSGEELTSEHKVNDAVQQAQDVIPNPRSADLETVSSDLNTQTSEMQTRANSTFASRLKYYMSRLRIFLLEEYGLSGLFHNRSFVLILPVAIAHGFGWASFVFHLDARAESVGLQPAQGATVLAVMGVGSMATSVSHGWFVDKGYISAEMAYVLAVLCSALVTFAMPVSVTMAAMAVASLVFGMATGVGEPLLFVILQLVVRPSEVAGATSINLVCWGFGEIIGTTLTGWIYDTYNNYNSAYYVAGASFVVGTILGLVIYVLQKRKKTGKEKLVNETDVVNNELQRTVSDETRHDRHELHINKDIRDEHGIANPIYVTAQTKEVVEQASSETTVNRAGQELTESDQNKVESSC